MKKILSFLLVSVLMLGIMGCKSEKQHEEQKKVEVVVAKMKENEKFTQDEYAASIKYATAGFKDMIKLWQTDCSSEEKAKLSAEYDAKYPDIAYIQVLLIEKGKPDDLDESNEKLYDEMMAAYNEMNEKNPFPLIEGMRESLLRSSTKGVEW